VVYGCGVSGRPVDLGGESMLGCSSTPARLCQVDPEQFLIVWLRLQAQQVEMRQYEYSPLVKIQGWSEVPPKHALFESMVFENYPAVRSVQNREEDRRIVNFTQDERM